MAKLPEDLREKAISMFLRGLDNGDVLKDLRPHVWMPEGELKDCIRRMKGKATRRKRSCAKMAAISSFKMSTPSISKKQQSLDTIERSNTPPTGSFEPARYAALREHIISMGSNHKAAEPYYAIIARDLLEGKEGFHSVMEIPGPSSGRPFDLMARKDGGYTVIELKGTLDGYGAPDQIQRARMHDMITYLEHHGIKVSPYLLQISLDKGKYRLWDPDCIKRLLNVTDMALGKSRPISEYADRIVSIIKKGMIPHDALIPSPDEIRRLETSHNPLCNFVQSERIVHPPKYLKRKIEPDITNNAVTSEIVWTYLVAYAYENHMERLVELLCGRYETLPPNSRIWLEAYLHPTRQRQYEGLYWKTRADLALGWLDRVQNNTRYQIQSKGDWLCIVEAKFFDDLHENAKFTNIVQLSQLIDHALYMPDKYGNLPKRVYVTLITPRCFKERSAPYRKYSEKFSQYVADSGVLIEDLKKCPLEFMSGLDQDMLIGRVNNLRLNWLTFEDLLGLDDLITGTSQPKPELRVKNWDRILEKVNDMRAGK